MPVYFWAGGAAGTTAALAALADASGRPTLRRCGRVVAAAGALVGTAASELTGIAPRLGRLAGWGAAALGPALASYTAVLVADTAVPAWHEARNELPVLFVGSAAAAGGGTGLLVASWSSGWPGFPAASSRPTGPGGPDAGTARRAP